MPASTLMSTPEWHADPSWHLASALVLGLACVRECRRFVRPALCQRNPKKTCSTTTRRKGELNKISAKCGQKSTFLGVLIQSNMSENTQDLRDYSSCIASTANVFCGLFSRRYCEYFPEEFSILVTLKLLESSGQATPEGVFALTPLNSRVRVGVRIHR